MLYWQKRALAAKRKVTPKGRRGRKESGEHEKVELIEFIPPHVHQRIKAILLQHIKQSLILSDTLNKIKRHEVQHVSIKPLAGKRRRLGEARP